MDIYLKKTFIFFWLQNISICLVDGFLYSLNLSLGNVRGDFPGRNQTLMIQSYTPSHTNAQNMVQENFDPKSFTLANPAKSSKSFPNSEPSIGIFNKIKGY